MPADYKIDYNKYSPISIICPTRHRCHGIYNFLESAYVNAWRFDTFEIIFVCDDDDKASPAWIDICKEKYPEMDISYYVRPRTEFLNRDCFNYGAERAKGKYLWNVGDDLEFILPHWDRAIFDNLDIFYGGREFDLKKAKLDRIVYINVGCDTPKLEDVKWPYSCFSIISREAIEAVGFFLIPGIPSWCSDYAIGELYAKSNRMMGLPEQMFKHVGVETASIRGDKVTARLNDIMIKHKAPQLAEKWRTEKLPNLIKAINEKITQAEQGYKLLFKTDTKEAEKFNEKTKGIKSFAKS